MSDRIFDSQDEQWMVHAIMEGRRAQGTSYPNPPVGCVLVSNDKILTAGFTQPVGGCHAERVCLNKIKTAPAGSTLYVTLEPCSHQNRTEPCVDIILEKGVSRVVIGHLDDNPAVCGNGVRILRRKNIEVVVGVKESIVQEDLTEYLWRARNNMIDGFYKEARSLWEQKSMSWVDHCSETSPVYKWIYAQNMLDALGNVKKRKILDLGGGEGYLTRVLQQQGAITTYLDQSEMLKDIAAQRSLNKESIYICGDPYDVLPHVGKFDAIVCNMMLHCIEELRPFLDLIYNCLISGGAFYATVMHPCFKAPTHGWVINERGEKDHYKVDRYGNWGLLTTAMKGGGPGGIQTLNIHRRLSEYINSVISTGFILSKTFEPRFDGEIVHEIIFELQDDYFRRAPVFGWLAHKPTL
jgi:pyrimidine deaminase RibD-like protein/2-polyprenyl-3-methyl-5-hydroxy-6-metoxy-1,4-benzoquinol methylase